MGIHTSLLHSSNYFSEQRQQQIWSEFLANLQRMTLMLKQDQVVLSQQRSDKSSNQLLA